jgi:hypothetical protein
MQFQPDNQQNYRGYSVSELLAGLATTAIFLALLLPAVVAFVPVLFTVSSRKLFQRGKQALVSSDA